jgi:hypothetical protein
MSCRDVSGRVQVRVAGKTARPAAEDGLALARSSVNRSACAAALRKPSLAARTQSRNFQQFAAGKRCARGDTSIQGHDFTRPWARDSARDDGECDVPASGAVERYPVGLHPSRHRPRPSKPDPARLRNPDLPSAPIQSADMSRSNCDNPEALAAPGLSPPRPSMSTLEEMLHGLGKVPQRLLLDHLASVAQPSMLRASRGQLPALLYISRRAPASGTPPRLLFGSQVPDESRLGAMVFEDHLLGGCGTQPVAAHTNTISRASDISGKLGRLSLKEPDARLKSA